jgi:hypothetical protein
MFQAMNKIISIIVFILSTTLIAYSHPGVGIVMDSKGNVFYTDLKHVWKIDTRGKLSIAVHHVHTHELYIDEHDNLFGEHLWYEGEAVDKWGHYVWKLSLSRKLDKIIPPTEGFLEKYSFVQDAHGKMFKADGTKPCQHLVQLNLKNEERRVTDACFADIRWMTISPGGNIFLIDQVDLKRITAKGEVETLAPKINERKLSQFTVNDRHLVMGVWSDQKENAYVAIYGGRMVKKVTPDKKVSVVAETSIGWSPTGGLVAPNGDFWLLECSPTNAVRVERITKDGRRQVYSATE